MNLVKFEVQINLEDPGEIQALHQFLNQLGGHDKAILTGSQKAKEDKPATKPKENKPAPPAAPAKEEKQAKSESSISIETVRAKLTEKVRDHRETIKAKLEELGAANVSTLDPVHFEDFYQFLNQL